MITGHLPELLIILVLALIVFGPQRLPEVTNSLGKAVREFRRATSELEDAVMHHAEADSEDDGEDVFPHVPPEPDTGDAPILTPTIDTLARRREMRHQAKQIPETPAVAGAEVNPESAS